jgi:hypothetical protein
VCLAWDASRRSRLVQEFVAIAEGQSAQPANASDGSG